MFKIARVQYICFTNSDPIYTPHQTLISRVSANSPLLLRKDTTQRFQIEIERSSFVFILFCILLFKTKLYIVKNINNVVHTFFWIAVKIKKPLCYWKFFHLSNVINSTSRWWINIDYVGCLCEKVSEIRHTNGQCAAISNVCFFFMVQFDLNIMFIYFGLFGLLVILYLVRNNKWMLLRLIVTVIEYLFGQLSLIRREIKCRINNKHFKIYMETFFYTWLMGCAYMPTV